MGTMSMYIMYDRLADQSGFVFEQTNDLTAIRSIRKQVTEDVDDHILYRIGEIDHKTMNIRTYEPVKIDWLNREVK